MGKEGEMIEVDISGGVEIGPFHYEVEVGEKAEEELRGEGRYGEISFQNQKIRVRGNFGRERFNETFLHEVIEGVNNEYCNNTLNHEEIVNLSNGLAQAMKSLGVNFVFKGG